MAQLSDGGTISVALDYEQFDFDESAVLSTSYQNVLVIRSKKIRESVIIFKNIDALIGMDYKIYASSKKAPDTSDLTSDEWVNLISVLDQTDSTTYDHNASRSLDATKNWYESFSNPYYIIVVQAKADSGTPTLKIWHRGQN